MCVYVRGRGDDENDKGRKRERERERERERLTFFPAKRESCLTLSSPLAAGVEALRGRGRGSGEESYWREQATPLRCWASASSCLTSFSCSSTLCLN